MISLGTCMPMNARISQTQCDANRKGVPSGPGRRERPPCLSCAGCSGLQNLQQTDYQPPITAADTNNTSVSLDQASVQKTEVGSMTKRITCKTCKRKDMALATGGECGRCYGRRKAGRDPLTNEPISVVSADNVELLSIQKPAAEIHEHVQSTHNYVHEPATPPQETALEPASSVLAACVAYMDAPPKPDRSHKPRPYPTPETITLPFTSLRDADLYGKLQCLAATHRRTLEAEILFQLEDRVMQIENVYLSILDK